MPKDDQIKKILSEADSTYKKFKEDLNKIKKKRQQVLSGAIKKGETKKIEQLKNKIQSL